VPSPTRVSLSQDPYVLVEPLDDVCSVALAFPIPQPFSVVCRYVIYRAYRTWRFMGTVTNISLHPEVDAAVRV